MARFPWLTCCLVSSALLASLLPGLGGALEFARAPIGNGEIWRLVSGQLVHWTPRMALLDLGAVLILGVWVERRSRILAVAVTSGGLLLTGLGLFFLAPDVEIYRGASGLASALFVAAALETLRDGGVSRRLAGAALLLFLAKVTWEMATGVAVAAGPLPAGVSVTPAVHLLGAGAGLLASGGHAVPRVRLLRRHPCQGPVCPRTGRGLGGRQRRHAPPLRLSASL